LKEYIKLIEDKLGAFNFGVQPLELYEPIRYILSLGGKRLRPILTLMSCQLFDEQIEKAIYPALGIEVFHNFTLLHDDIMDHAPIRRGQQTVHEKWDANIAILSGDVMLVRAYDLFLKTDHAELKKILSKFSKCASEVCEGQQFDMNFETRDFVSEFEYLEMIKLKTAVLLAFSIELGAIIGGADEKQSAKLYDFGINLGLGFQLKDDLLDVFSDTAKFGKQTGGDIISNKKTYLLIKAIEKAEGELKEELLFWLNEKQFDPEEKVKAVIQIYEKLGIKELTELKMNDYFNKSLEIFDSIEIAEQKKEALKALSLKLIDREN
jgi:geranylgeranyl diphosphate synthase type II